ncbi:MAG TPA: mandelate racemase/muconate lactonizing enzyme family protein [Pirellulales bacterium]|nr:mandelate racemase/muconate lactonizing enzyme family protein [Pirellulales bacterium]
MQRKYRVNRRTVLGTALAASAWNATDRIVATMPDPGLLLTGIEVFPVRATERTVWIFVRLQTNRGLTGLGEASDAFGYLNTTDEQVARMKGELGRFFELLKGKPPDVEQYRANGKPRARQGGLVSATAYSAIEQGLWDLIGKAEGVPSFAVLARANGWGDNSERRNTIPVYANINRATRDRTPEGFALVAKAAAAAGFRALKAAPFDGFPKPGSRQADVDAAVDRGIACMTAMREAVGPEIELMVDCHSYFDVVLGRSVARRMESLNLAWFEEPVAPEQVADTLAIRQGIRQPMAGGELLFGVEGFRLLCDKQAVHVIMPDVKHCGGLQELLQIAALADEAGLRVAPHNPSGPVGTAASVQACAVLKNLDSLEIQWNEVDWRADVVAPPETIIDGRMKVPNAAGFGIELQEVNRPS